MRVPTCRLSRAPRGAIDLYNRRGNFAERWRTIVNGNARGRVAPLFSWRIDMKALVIAFAAAALAACTTTNPDVIQKGDAQRLSQVQDATVLSVRPVIVEGNQSGGGAVAGGVIGGISGSSVGGRRDAAVVGILAAVVGSVVGNAIERAATREDAVEFLLQLKNGERRTLVQAKGGELFAPGDPVILVTTGGKTRIVRAPGATPAANPTAAPAARS
jgi:outer membrane lipoprotein SlyB